MKRVFLIVLDSVGIGELPDAGRFGDEGSNTLFSASEAENFAMPNMRELGLFNIEGLKASRQAGVDRPSGVYGRMAEVSNGKDTTIGHWELAGIISENPLPVFPEGFPAELIAEFERETGRRVICNKPYSGTEVIKDYGKEHMETGALIVYTSADSVFQIAAHEEIIEVPELYRYCEIARRLCMGKYSVGRIIARPFVGEYPNFKRTSNRHDYSLVPPSKTMLDYLKEAGYEVRSVGKINDIFAGQGITSAVKTSGNVDGIDKTIDNLKAGFEGLCFTNLVDFDSVYGHRNDVQGYGDALSYFDKRLPELLELLKDEDVLIVTADHGCDPKTVSTDHSREYVPVVIYKNGIKSCNLGTRDSFADVAATILEYFGVKGDIAGKSFLDRII